MELSPRTPAAPDALHERPAPPEEGSSYAPPVGASNSAPGGSVPHPTPAVESEWPRQLWKPTPPPNQSALVRRALTIERQLERVVVSIKAMAVVELVQLVASLSVLWSAATYLAERDDRARAARDARIAARDARIADAWQTLNSAEGRSGSAGRDRALETLVRERVALDRIDLQRAVLDGVDLHGASLFDARLDSARLVRANLGCADTESKDDCSNPTRLERVTLRGADLDYASLAGADLWGADLRCSDTTASFDPRFETPGARPSLDFRYAWPGCASLYFADLRGAQLTYARLNGANLAMADLRRVTLLPTIMGAVVVAPPWLTRSPHSPKGATADWRTNVTGAVLYGANVAGALPLEFREWAVRHGAIDDSAGNRWRLLRDSVERAEFDP